MKRFRTIFLTLLCIFAFTAFALGSGSSSGKSSESKKEVEEEKSADASENKEEAASGKEKEETSKDTGQSELKDAYYVGDTISYKGLEITYVSSSYYTSDNQFITPKDGNQFIRIQIHADNQSGSDKTVTAYEFNCYADGYECEKTYQDDDLSATLSNGRSGDGAVYFEVPINASEIEIEYELDWINEKKAKLIFEGDKDSGLTFEANTSQNEEAYRVGDTIETKYAKITYAKAAEYSSDNMFITPKDGYKYIYIELEVENTSQTDQNISYFSFQCYADGASCDGFYGMDDALSATLSPGRKAKGTIAFEVPKDAETIEIEYEDNVWTQNKIIFLYE